MKTETLVKSSIGTFLLLVGLFALIVLIAAANPAVGVALAAILSPILQALGSAVLTIVLSAAVAATSLFFSVVLMRSADRGVTVGTVLDSILQKLKLLIPFQSPEKIVHTVIEKRGVSISSMSEGSEEEDEQQQQLSSAALTGTQFNRLVMQAPETSMPNGGSKSPQEFNGDPAFYANDNQDHGEHAHEPPSFKN